MAKEQTVQPPEPDPLRELTLDDIVGNEPARAFLRRSARSGRLPQALLLTGPSGIGKTTTAWALLRELAADGADPRTHPGALKIERGVHPDVHLPRGRTVSGQIGVGEIRELENKAYYAPLEAPRRMVLIDPADRMNVSAANCLLKLLEEPPPRLQFVLVCDEASRLIETIRSRCAAVTLEPVPTGEIVNWLMDRHRMKEDRARLLAPIAEGRPGWALTLAAAGALERRGAILEAVGWLAEHGFAALFRVSDQIARQKGELTQTLLVAVLLLRDALILKLGEGRLINEDLREELHAVAQRASAEGLLEAADRLTRAAGEAPYYYMPQARALFVECLMTDVGRVLRK